MPRFGIIELLILGLVAVFAVSLLAVLVYVVHHALSIARKRE